MRTFPEYPEKPNSRSYVETLHAAHPVATLDFPSLFQLPDRLLPVSLTQLDTAFAPLVLDVGQAVPLPRGWFEQSRAMLVALVAGTPLDCARLFPRRRGVLRPGDAGRRLPARDGPVAGGDRVGGVRGAPGR